MLQHRCGIAATSLQHAHGILAASLNHAHCIPATSPRHPYPSTELTSAGFEAGCWGRPPLVPACPGHRADIHGTGTRAGAGGQLWVEHLFIRLHNHPALQRPSHCKCSQQSFCHECVRGNQGTKRPGSSIAPRHEPVSGAGSQEPGTGAVWGGQAAGRAGQGSLYLLHSSTSASRSSLLGFFCRS